MSRRIVPKPDIARIMAEVFDARSNPPRKPAVVLPARLRACVGRTDGMQCWAPVHVQLESIPLCDEHLRIVEESLAALKSPIPDPAAGFHVVAHAVVYYLGDPESAEVKIGTTTRLRHRFMTLSTLRQKAVLLATEPGSHTLERKRHRQFRTLRMHGEWFRKAPLLMEHIGRVRLDHGILLTGDGQLPTWAIAPVRNPRPSAAGVSPQSGATRGERIHVE